MKWYQILCINSHGAEKDRAAPCSAEKFRATRFSGEQGGGPAIAV